MFDIQECYSLSSDALVKQHNDSNQMIQILKNVRNYTCYMYTAKLTNSQSTQATFNGGNICAWSFHKCLG